MKRLKIIDELESKVRLHAEPGKFGLEWLREVLNHKPHEGARGEDSGKHRNQDADDQGDGEALHYRRAEIGAEVKQDQSGENG